MPRHSIVCATCGEPFDVPPARASVAKYCSATCYGDAKRGHRRTKQRATLICAGCGTTFERWLRDVNKATGKGYQEVFCSQRCHRDTEHRRRVERRNSLLEGAWREFVLERDGYQCQKCGATKRLHAHHLRHYATFPAGRFDPANGITLCVDCHRNCHRGRRAA
jgi:hypothetical protein